MNVAVVAAGGLIGFGLLAAHQMGDWWTQTHRQATNKGLPGWPGRRACLEHVISYTMCTTLVVGLLWALFDLPITWVGFLAGQLVSATSHYWADRRTTLEKLCTFLGKGEFYQLGQPRDATAIRVIDKQGLETVQLYPATVNQTKPGRLPWDNTCLGTGAHALDQAWHWLFLFIATIVTVTL